MVKKHFSYLVTWLNYNKNTNSTQNIQEDSFCGGASHMWSTPNSVLHTTQKALVGWSTTAPRQIQLCSFQRMSVQNVISSFLVHLKPKIQQSFSFCFPIIVFSMSERNFSSRCSKWCQTLTEWDNSADWLRNRHGPTAESDGKILIYGSWNLSQVFWHNGFTPNKNQ